MSRLIVIYFLCFICTKAFSQCSTCTSCTISSSSGCTYTVASNSSTNYTVGSGQKLCITGGTYTGKVTFNGGTAVVDNGVTFSPSSTPVSGTGNVLEIKSGATASIAGFNISTNVGMTLNNCGTTNMNGISKASSSGTLNVNNNGTFVSNNDFKYSSGSDGNICNSGSMTMVNLTLSSGTNSLINNGILYMTGNMSLSTNASVTLCAASYAEVDGGFNASGGATINSPGTCGQMKVKGNSNCSGCNMTGYVDFCDSSGAALTNSPHVDNNSGGSWAATMTYCTCNTLAALLPVTLIEFNARAENEKVRLEWTTAAEINNDYFTIERSSDGINYTSILTLKGAGSSTRSITYHVYDEQPLPGISYYRLRQTDFDGHAEVFSPVAINAVKKSLIYPNPAKNNLNLFITSAGSWCTIELYDMTEKMVQSEKQTLSPGMNSLSIDLSSLTNSMYFIKAETAEGIFFDKFVKSVN